MRTKDKPVWAMEPPFYQCSTIVRMAWQDCPEELSGPGFHLAGLQEDGSGKQKRMTILLDCCKSAFIMKNFLTLILSLFPFAGVLFGQKKLPPEIRSIYDFKVRSLGGGVIDFSAFRGKKILIVNTASRCGHTGQYEGLQELSTRYADKLVVVGFPCNDFLFQEPGSAGEIEQFCKVRYGVTFPMADKIHVKGNDTAPVYVWLMNKQYNHFADSKIKWNFQKYLVNEKGDLTDVFDPDVEPMSDSVLTAIGR